MLSLAAASHYGAPDLRHDLRSGKETDATLAALGAGHVVMLAMVPATAGARPQTRRSSISNHGDWTVYEVTDSRGRVCYLASEPANQTGNYSRRDNPAVLVVRLPGKPPSEQVSVHPGYPYKKDSKVEVDDRRPRRSSCSPTASMPSPTTPTTRTD